MQGSLGDVVFSCAAKCPVKLPCLLQGMINKGTASHLCYAIKRLKPNKQRAETNVVIPEWCVIGRRIETIEKSFDDSSSLNVLKLLPNHVYVQSENY